jgi:hypothetical protein
LWWRWWRWWETENIGLVLGVVGAAFVVLLACCGLGWWL